MIPREFRLKHMKDFDILFKEGRFVGGSVINLKYWQIKANKYPRRKYLKNDLKIGFVVGLKVHKSAVKRNRVKRQMREVVRLLLKEDKLKQGYMLALMAKPGIIGKDYKEIESGVMEVLKKAGIFK
ncbi:MAG: ribonuclease P protein component [Candidatus Magasanikbacteria bacterium]|nr:ribonuclease P protein component [Candidatus Magasanikbacteria bacterium]